MERVIKGVKVKVSDEDAELLDLAWCLNNGGYLTAKYQGATWLLHRLVAQRAGLDIENSQVDHKNRDRADCTRDNLRLSTQSQNSANKPKSAKNTSGYKGVGWHKARGMWRAFIRVNRTDKHLGHFHDPVEAAKAYDKAALEAWGEYASINFPEAA